MADVSEVLEVFLKPMKRLFARPLHSVENDESAIMGEYIEALKPFSKATLEAGWKTVRESQTGRFWPPIAVCIRACSACQSAFREAEKAKRSGDPKPVAGRMVNGKWQPFVGCECDRCLESRAKYHADNVAWYEFCARKYGESSLAPAQKAALDRRRSFARLAQ